MALWEQEAESSYIGFGQNSQNVLDDSSAEL